MVPLHDNNPTEITRWVNYGLIAANVLVLGYMLMLSPGQLETFFQTFAVVPEQLKASFQSGNPTQFGEKSITLITSQFLHPRRVSAPGRQHAVSLGVWQQH